MRVSETLGTIAALVFLAGCNAKTPADSVSSDRSANPQVTMTRVAKAMRNCWFTKKDPALRGFSMSPELNSLSGKPRILIVPRNNPGGLPKMVVQAERIGGRTQLTSFGPLVQSNDGPRLVAAVNNWGRGRTACA
ncbi:hypothetical protein ACFQ14_16920 [Pseudahrensia aquimaris]|uniref:Lipoprotein n=1 Tax=Pseudahrensia aquimaris TaxID=744461 RepID=A0ABW3FJY7_9HYPH